MVGIVQEVPKGEMGDPDAHCGRDVQLGQESLRVENELRPSKFSPRRVNAVRDDSPGPLPDSMSQGKDKSKGRVRKSSKGKKEEGKKEERKPLGPLPQGERHGALGTN